ncbi:MAG: ATP-binding protein [Deltaproteobacteria bacterium]|nr:ATP-binding protein [Deltaproteobacteria bacterium]
MTSQQGGSAMFERSFSPDAGIGWRLSRLVAELHPGRSVLDGVESPFDLQEFVAEGRCDAECASDVHAQMRTAWSRAHGLREGPVNAVYDVRWQGHLLRVVTAKWRAGLNDTHQYAIVVADSVDVARAFATAVSAFCNEPRRAVLVFKGGCWGRSRDLWEQIQAASFDDLVLMGDLKARIREDFAAFLAARSEYERYGVPHKRGVLLIGPPGNGKTHCLRALIRELALPCLYVMNIKQRYTTDEENIDQVFERAREVTPCLLVFEDLDAMITDKNRSYFLNQLDGLATLTGVVTVATTNHPERLDPAILERPSRFDRKYHFELPGPAERRTYLAAWNARLDPAMGITEAELDALAAQTHQFSFAYLKELYLSGMVRWVTQRTRGTMAALLDGQVHALREQMQTDHAQAAAAPLPAHTDDDNDDNE